MEVSKKNNFQIVAESLLLYHQHNDLFADQIVSEKMGIPSEEIRQKIKEWFHQPVEKVISILDPVIIRRRISETISLLNKPKKQNSPVQIVAMDSDNANLSERKLILRFQFNETPFGNVLIASSGKGVCYLGFADKGSDAAMIKLKERFPEALLLEEKDNYQKEALSAFDVNTYDGHVVHLHLKGTPFQISTWKKLLQIPSGGLLSYSALTDDKKYSHAMGNAVGSNPVAFLIPCHRTVPATGEFGEYHWGKARKSALICMEAFRNPL
ncbi:MAG: methylated-DNA--[protein]-cysteine S-methyltransferase [Chitinophagaceae bacterium]|nr:methylated-DNA--[protein]-cysteine S-methyltransferase [Chitinophagaceae bacterium]